ncbi:MAG TPA: YkvA family protein [Candidatus Limnocylindria bacterium]|nr:YkvA family protein [Candidatus Limnocylindria bacterium]
MAESGTRDSDPFPKERLLALVKRLPRYARLAWRLGNEPGLSRGRRAAVMGAAAYLVSPVDLVPGIIPVAGQLDDAAVGLLALRFALRGLPPADQAAHLAAVQVSLGDIEEDLATVRQSAGWMVRRGGRLTARAGKAALRSGFRGARELVRGVRALRVRGE